MYNYDTYLNTFVTQKRIISRLCLIFFMIIVGSAYLQSVNDMLIQSIQMNHCELWHGLLHPDKVLYVYTNKIRTADME